MIPRGNIPPGPLPIPFPCEWLNIGSDMNGDEVAVGDGMEANVPLIIFCEGSNSDEC